MSIRTTAVSRLLFAAALGPALLLAAIGCGEAEAPQAKGKGKARILEPVKVQTGESAPAIIRPNIRITGTLYAFEEVTISAKVAGRIISLAHDLGDRVEPNRTLVQIDRTDYELAVKERQSAIRATLAKIDLTEFPSGTANLDEVPTVKRSLVQLSNVQGRYERLKKLFQQTPPLISEQEYADAETEYKVSRSAYEVEKSSAHALLAEAMRLQAELNLANQRLADTDIRTPADQPQVDLGAALSSTTDPALKPGEAAAATRLFDDENPKLRFVVAQRLASVGEYVREGTPLYRLIDDDPVKLRALLPERYSGQINTTLKVKVNVQAHENTFDGRITRISPQVDPASRTYAVEILITNPNGHLKPGTFATAVIELPNEQPAVRVPVSAVTSFAGIHKVFTIADGKAVENRVTLGERDKDSILLTAGLEPNQRIILAPPAQLVGGTPLILPASTEKE